MDVVFGDEDLRRLADDARFNMGIPPHLVSRFRSRVQTLRAANDTRDLRAMKSLHFEKLKGNRSHQYSIRLNHRYRIILELTHESGEQAVTLLGIEDYH